MNELCVGSSSHWITLRTRVNITRARNGMKISFVLSLPVYTFLHLSRDANLRRFSDIANNFRWFLLEGVHYPQGGWLVNIFPLWLWSTSGSLSFSKLRSAQPIVLVLCIKRSQLSVTIKKLLLQLDAMRHAAFSCGISFVVDDAKKSLL